MPRLSLALALIAAPLVAQASPVKTEISGAELRGEATFRLVGLPIYNARLYTPGGSALDWQQDFGLEVNYLRRVSQDDLVDSTLREMERIGAKPPSREQFLRCFDDVGRGDSYLAISDGPNSIGFWRNGTRVCTLSHPSIKLGFMSVFLGENTRSARFTQALRGQ